jgi:hypothetical protein
LTGVIPVMNGVPVLAIVAQMVAQMTTGQWDNARTGTNLHETKLTPANVNARQFGKLFSLKVDGDVYAQPLYLPHVPIPGKGTHNVLFVATEHDSVYAFDADTASSEPLWHVKFLSRGSGTSTVAAGDVQCPFIQPEIGITPTLADGQVFLTWGSSCDIGPYHGWVMAYDKATLKQTGVLNTSPGAGQSGIWQADNGPAADEQGNVYAATGNGKFNASSGGHDYGDSVLKLKADSGNLMVRDYFTPSNQQALNARDADVGSGGPMLLPGTRLLLTGGKNGVLYVLDHDHMGQYQSGGNSHAIETLRLGQGIYSAPAYWNGHIYIIASDDFLSDFVVYHGRLPAQPTARGGYRFPNPGATPAVSADGTKNGIVWALETRVWNDFGKRPAVLHAWDATDMGHELYSSGQNGPALRFAVPTVVNGRVYVGTKGEVDVYGLL